MKKFTLLLFVTVVLIVSTGCELIDDYTSSRKYRENTDILASEITNDDSQTESTTTQLYSPDTSDKPQTQESSGNIRKEFQEAMDSYELFFDEYCTFMKNFKNDPSNTTLLTQYSTIMTQYTETMSKMSAWKNEDLNDEELQYYIEVNDRITQKLLEIAQ